MNLPVLAAWLHDIGKFAQRAGERRSSLEHEYCPKSGYNGRYSHQHVLYTDYFIEHILPLPPELEGSRSILADLAASHHRADGKSRDHLAIQRADRLSAGMDRTESEKEGDFIAERLNSIFAKVRLGGSGLPEDALAAKYQLRPLAEKDSIFPAANAGNGPGYKALWREFILQLKNLPCHLGEAAWQASLISLLERYCWCVPSATWRSLPDVSLYDHAAAAAAITQALLGCPQGEEKFLLFGGDLSGIQAFIFGREEPAGKGAAKLLRARSFLLQAVTRSVWLALLKRLKLDASAKIMDAGGRFVLLLPDTLEVRRQLDMLEDEAEIWLLEKFCGAVRLNFARLGLSEIDLGKEKFAGAFDRFNDVLEAAKLQPFSRAFAAGKLPWLPVEYSDYARFGECAFCHSRPATAMENQQPICKQCGLLMKLGAKLPETRFIVFTDSRQSGGDMFANLLFANIALHFYDERPPEAVARHALQILSIRDEPIFTTAPIAGHVPLITPDDLLRWQAEGRLSRADGETFFMGEDCVEGNPKTFAMLAQEARIPPRRQGEPWTSVPCLGICKADVDNLGLIFSMGFGDNFSLSCYAMLARMLNHFFSGHLMEVIRREFPNIYVVFAGGDDVFAIGPWSETIAFGMRMAEDFRKFCGNNPAVTISAGMPLVKAGLPMRGMREEAENRLEDSKNYANGAKNAVTIFGVSGHWAQARELLDAGRELADLCGKGMVSRGFIRRLLGYSRECGAFARGENLALNGLYLSHFQYDLARNWNVMAAGGKPANVMDGAAEAAGVADAAFGRLQRWAVDKDFFSKLEMGISWAIYRTRISA